MNIGVFVDNELNNDKRVLREIKILLEQGHTVFALALGIPGKKYNTIEGVKLNRFYLRKRIKNVLFFLMNTVPLYEWFLTKKIRKFLSENSIDVLHAHDLYLARASRSAIIRSGREVRLVLDLHENFAFQITSYSWTKGFIRKVLSRPGAWVKKEGIYLGYADKIVVLSAEFRDLLTQLYPFLSPDNFCVLPNVPDVAQMNEFKPNPNILSFSKRAPILFYFGIVAERRGIFETLEVFEVLITKGYSIDFLIIGPVDRKDLKRFGQSISREKIRERVIYKPWIDLSELPAYLDAADICIAPFHKNPQHESGVANKIYDYMLGSKPLVVSNCMPQKNLVEKYNCGISYETAAEMEESVIRLLEDPGLRERLGRNGYRAILEDLNSNTASVNLINLYRSIEKEKARQ
jgi:glycosyltransferase involved in cell wall biosynthesis